jgi:hypothetical protein
MSPQGDAPGGMPKQGRPGAYISDASTSDADREVPSVDAEPAWIRDALSPERFAPYLAATGGDAAAAMALYRWNVEVSGAFYTPLECLEVTLRNAVHRHLAQRFDRPDWWVSAPLNGRSRRIVAATRAKLATRGRPPTDGDMVAGLSLGFWVALVSGAYHRTLWERGLHRAFPFYRGPRRRLHDDLQTMLLFRNRIMHYEPIHHRHLEADHGTLLRIVGCISQHGVEQLKNDDPVPAALGRRPDAKRPAPGGTGRWRGSEDHTS